MSTLALPLRVGKTRVAARSGALVDVRLSAKRLLQVGLVAFVLLPIPNDDGPLAITPAQLAAHRAALPIAFRVEIPNAKHGK